MDRRDTLTRQPARAAAPAAARPAVFGAELFRRQALAEELAQGAEAVARLGPRVECLYVGACATGAPMPGVAAFEPVPPPHPGGDVIARTIALRLRARPALLRAVQVAVFRFEDFRRTLTRAAAAEGPGAGGEGLVEELRRKAYLVTTLGLAFQDEPALSQLFPPPETAMIGTAPLPAPAPPPDTGVARARALADRIGACLPAIEAVLALVAQPTAPRLGEILSTAARTRRVLAVRLAAAPPSLALVREVRAAHQAVEAAIAAVEGGTQDARHLAAPCGRLAHAMAQGRRDPLAALLFEAPR